MSTVEHQAEPEHVAERYNAMIAAIGRMTTREDHITVMAMIDHHYHFEDTALEWNERLRRNVKQCYNKIGLTEADCTLFAQWDAALQELPLNAPRLDIFTAAPEQCLYIVGL